MKMIIVTRFKGILIGSIVVVCYFFSLVGFLQAQQGAAVSEAARSTEEAQRPSYESYGKRNPFIPYVTSDGQLINIQVTEEKKEVLLNLEGVVYDPGGVSLVIINGEILQVGDTFGNIKIIAIKKEAVVYSQDGKLSVINVRREE